MILRGENNIDVIIQEIRTTVNYEAVWNKYFLKNHAMALLEEK